MACIPCSISDSTSGRRKEDEVKEFSPSGAQQVPFSGCMHAGLMQTAHALEPPSPAPPAPACAMPQYSPTGDDILMIFIGHRYYRTYRYYRPALTYILWYIVPSLQGHLKLTAHTIIYQYTHSPLSCWSGWGK